MQRWRRESAPSRWRTLLNRELSHLEFHARVLELATDETLPLLERVKFCAIFSSNLDEFFQVRVAGLLGQAEAGVTVRSADGLTPQQALARIRERVLELSALQSRLWKRELRPALAAEGITVGGIEDLGSKELEKLERRFHREIYPVLTPLAVGPGQPFPYISGLSLSLAIFAEDPETGDERFARVKIPEGLPRFFDLGGRGLYVPLEQIIAHFLPTLFPGVDDRRARGVPRDARRRLRGLRRRRRPPRGGRDPASAPALRRRRARRGELVRVVRDGRPPPERPRGRRDAGLSRREPARPLGAPRAGDDRPARAEARALDPRDPPAARSAQTDSRRSSTRSGAATSSCTSRTARIVASFEVFAQAAVRDPNVIAMKTAVYRTSDDSVLVGSLIQCAEEGKQSVCLVELKARFDELRNIEWSRELEQAGVHVAYGFPDLKIHAKMTLIVRREGDALRRYAHIGTGNYHAATARLYEDLGIFTADEEITADVADLFNYITGFGRPQKFRKLLVAPFTLRSGLVDEIRGVAAAAGAASTRASGSSSTTSSTRRSSSELYEASRAGARVDIIARSTCALRPGVEGLSENIHVRSVVGRFLEHSRDLLVRGRRARRDVHREPRSHAAQPRPPNRGAHAGRERACPAGDPRDPRQRARRTTRTPGSSEPSASGRAPSRRSRPRRTRITRR